MMAEAVKAEIELLTCPFCGSPNIDPEGWVSINQDGTQKKSGPACDECGGSAESVERWNTRWNVVDDNPAPHPETAVSP